MGEPKIPVFLAVGFWAASALAVLGYTYIAFKETAKGAESGAWGAASVTNPLVAGADVLTAGLASKNAKGQSAISQLPEAPPGTHLRPSFKPLERGKFNPSR